MRLPRLRFTIRRLMIMVLIVAVALALGREIPALLRQRDEYARRARMFAWDEEQRRGFLRDVPYLFQNPADTPRGLEYRLYLEEQVENAERFIPYSHEMRLKYERAAVFFWCAVPPDPPLPQ